MKTHASTLKPCRCRLVTLALAGVLVSGTTLAQQDAPLTAETAATALAGIDPGARALAPPPPVAEFSAEELCVRIAAKLHSIKTDECLRYGLQASGGVSVEGYPILTREFPPLAQRQPKGRVLLLGGIHGDELSSVSIVFKWMEILERYHSGMFHWRFAPVVNPDGLLNIKPQRTNANGVDLNRNFPTPNWATESHQYWVKDTNSNPRRFPGAAPLSEPESQWLARAIEEFQPDAIVSVHAPFGVLDFDGPPRPPDRLGHLYLNLLGTYPGSLGNYAGVHKQIPVVTIELPNAGFLPSRDEMSSIWTDLIRWLNNNVKTRPQPAQMADQTSPS